jgi:putative lipoprotein
MKLHYLLPLLFPLCAIAGEERIPYACDNGSRLDISYSVDAEGRPQANLHFADDTVTLPQVPASSGTLYRAGNIRLHTKGDDAILEDAKSNLRRCTRGTVPPAAIQSVVPVASSSFIDITGSVTYLARIALPPGAILSIRIQDTARSPARTLVEQRYELDGAQVPIPFSATLDKDLLGKKPRLTLTARIEHHGKLRFISDKVYPVLKDGQAAPVDMVLKPAPAKKQDSRN